MSSTVKVLVILAALFTAGYMYGLKQDHIQMSYVINTDYSDILYKMTDDCVERNVKDLMTEEEKTQTWMMCHDEYTRIFLRMHEIVK